MIDTELFSQGEDAGYGRGEEIHKPQSHHRLELLLSNDTGNRLLGSGDGIGAINEVSRHSVAAGPEWNVGACFFVSADVPVWLFFSGSCVFSRVLKSCGMNQFYIRFW
jgi:hypothetical protein